MAKEKRVERLKKEMVGVLLLFCAIFFLLCLLSYSSSDPSLNRFSTDWSGVKNWGGLVGAYFSDLIFQGFGIAGYFIFILIFFSAGYELFGKEPLIRGRKSPWIVARATGLFSLIVFSCGFLSLAFDKVLLHKTEFEAGGLLGFLVAEGFRRTVGAVGGMILIWVGIIVSLMVGFHISVIKVFQLLEYWLYYLKATFENFYVRYRERRKRKEEVKKERELLTSFKELTEPKISIVGKGTKEKPATLSMEGLPKQEKLGFFPGKGNYVLPPLKLLDTHYAKPKEVDRQSLVQTAKILEKKLADFGVAGEVVEVMPGPVVTMYEFKLASGVKINRIVNLADDLACALSALSVRIIAPVPGKGVVGIEVANQEREMVSLKEILASEAYTNLSSPLALALGKDIVGEPYVIDLRKAPHLLVAGATGSGKSVSLNAMIMSVLFRATPAQVKMLLIDPKRLELSIYEGIPHLLHSVISDPKEAAMALKWAVMEMEERYRLLADYGVRNIDAYNRLVEQGKIDKKKKRSALSGEGEKEGTTLVIENRVSDAPKEILPLILIVIDELADLMMVAARDCEESITRLAQMARASGIHIVVATQRPSVDVITGLIKANFSARISFQVSSKIDSRTILDQNGAEKLLGMGDMLYLSPGSSELERIHGAYVSDIEIKRVVGFWKKQGKPGYNEKIIQPSLNEDMLKEKEEVDELYEQALAIVATTRQASISMLQRKLRVGYNRAARMIERMEAEGLVGPADGAKPREVYIDPIHLEGLMHPQGGTK